MTKQEFNKRFKEEFPNWKAMTFTDRRVNWGDMKEAYHRNGLITDRQRETWVQPAFLERHRDKIDCNAY